MNIESMPRIILKKKTISAMIDSELFLSHDDRGDVTFFAAEDDMHIDYFFYTLYDHLKSLGWIFNRTKPSGTTVKHPNGSVMEYNKMYENRTIVLKINWTAAR